MQTAEPPPEAPAPAVRTRTVKRAIAIDNFAPRFAEALRRASERRLLTLYDEVADS